MPFLLIVRKELAIRQVLVAAVIHKVRSSIDSLFSSRKWSPCQQVTGCISVLMNGQFSVVDKLRSRYPSGTVAQYQSCRRLSHFSPLLAERRGVGRGRDLVELNRVGRGHDLAEQHGVGRGRDLAEQHGVGRGRDLAEQHGVGRGHDGTHILGACL